LNESITPIDYRKLQTIAKHLSTHRSEFSIDRKNPFRFINEHGINNRRLRARGDGEEKDEEKCGVSHINKYPKMGKGYKLNAIGQRKMPLNEVHVKGTCG
jgi:hypothetical protein